MKLFILFYGFIAGLSVGALLSWKDDDYQSPMGLVWVGILVVSVSSAIVSLLL